MTDYRDALTHQDWRVDPAFSNYLEALERVYRKGAS